MGNFFLLAEYIYFKNIITATINVKRLFLTLETACALGGHIFNVV